MVNLVVDSTSLFAFCLVSPISSELELSFQLPGTTESITLQVIISFIFVKISNLFPDLMEFRMKVLLV